MPFFRLLIALSIGAMSTLCASAAAPAAATRPNVLLIVADDLGFSDLGAYGGEIRTPHLDRLANEGLRYTQFYNNAVCVTTRASLITGLYPGQGRNADGQARPNVTTLGEVMRTAGYGTALIGKWHLGSTAPRRPIDRGFDEFYGVLDGACNYFNPGAADPGFYGGKHRTFAHNDQRLTEFPAGYYTTDAFSDHAIKMIRQYAATARPFFINLNYTAPHFPLHAPPEDIARYRGKYADGYDVLRERRYRRQIELGIIDPAVTKLSPLDKKSGDFRYDYHLVPWAQLEPTKRKREEERMEVYAAMVDRMDQGIGRVLAALQETGLAKDTVVMFVSDNGGCASVPAPNEMAAYLSYNVGIPVGDARGYEFVGVGWGWAQNTPFRRHKVWTYEGGIGTPMIVRWPAMIKPGTITAGQGHVVDFMPTLLELAGGTYPKTRHGQAMAPMEGQSLLPTWRGSSAWPRVAPLFWELYGNRAMRDGDWKLVWTASTQRWELYDLSKDRSELVDLAGQHPRRVATMAASWDAWATRTEVSHAVP